jgi:hypothetical protein
MDYKEQSRCLIKMGTKPNSLGNGVYT